MTTMPFVKLKRFLLLLAVTALVVACVPEAEEEEEGYPYSGTSSVGAPSTITGYKMVQTVQRNDGKTETIDVGETITYQFVDSQTILGDGLVTLSTTSWSYTTTGGSGAKVTLNYSNGTTTETLNFTSATGGTYRSDLRFYATGNTYWHEGVFTITPVSTTSGGTSGTSCTASTGQLTIYSTFGSDGPITVKIDGVTAGTLTSHYTSGSPTCGTTSTGAVITKTVTAGTHSVASESANYTWGPSSHTVSACGCTRVVLN